MYLASNTNNTCLIEGLSKSPKGSLCYSELDQLLQTICLDQQGKRNEREHHVHLGKKNRTP